MPGLDNSGKPKAMFRPQLGYCLWSTLALLRIYYELSYQLLGQHINRESSLFLSAKQKISEDSRPTSIAQLAL